MQPPFVLFDDASLNGTGGVRLFDNPHRVLSCTRAEDVAQTLAAIDAAIADGYFVAGFMAYELGYMLEAKLAPLLPDDRKTPLIWMGVFDAPRTLSNGEAERLFRDWAAAPYAITEPQADIGREDYIAHVERVREHIRVGDVYQINYTFTERFELTGSPLALYAQLRSKQRAKWGAIIATGKDTILSLSPELFFEREGATARTRPMKGTASRSANPEDDVSRGYWLRHDEKSRAENLMIVDLLRNDLGRIAEVGTVKVTDLFKVESYPTLHQLTSTVEAELRMDTPFSAWAHALFPCGSVTGAPKVKAMEIIRTLENKPRGVYTGAVGYAGPNEARFNVAIRTLACDQDGPDHWNGEIGIGSGIVYDSDPAQEWDECHLKARFLTDPVETFELLETLKWEPGVGFALLDRHMERLEKSAEYFGYSVDINVARQALQDITGDTAQRVRLLLNANGEINIEAQDLGQVKELSFTTRPAPFTADNPFTYHKTTNRKAYDQARADVPCDEVVFINARGELTEGSYTNVFIERDGQLLTPPLSCGLLPGTLRQELLDNRRAVEAVLTLTDLKSRDRIWLGNSVRGLVKATFCEAV